MQANTNSSAKEFEILSLYEFLLALPVSSSSLLLAMVVLFYNTIRGCFSRIPWWVLASFRLKSPRIMAHKKVFDLRGFRMWTWTCVYLHGEADLVELATKPGTNMILICRYQVRISKSMFT